LGAICRRGSIFIDIETIRVGTALRVTYLFCSKRNGTFFRQETEH
jgi:hypothetical protein